MIYGSLQAETYIRGSLYSRPASFNVCRAQESGCVVLLVGSATPDKLEITVPPLYAREYRAINTTSHAIRAREIRSRSSADPRRRLPPKLERREGGLEGRAYLLVEARVIPV